MVLRRALEVGEFVNADTIAAGRVMLYRVHELAGERRDFAFETTLASRSFAPWLRDLRTDGYAFHLVYLWLPTVELALARVAERVRLYPEDRFIEAELPLATRRAVMQAA